MEQKKKTDPKLNSEHKSIIIQMLADFRANKEILEFFKSEFGIELTSASITYYKVNHEDQIIAGREKLAERLLAIPVANKFWRIELRQKLIADIVSGKDGTGRLWVTLRNKYGEHKKGNHGIVNDLLDSVRSEMEPNKISLTDPTGKTAINQVVILPAVIGPDGKPMIELKEKEDDGKPNR